MDEPADMIGPITVEFHDGTDFCIGTNITFPNLDITFFELVQHFMVGPVPLSLGEKKCMVTAPPFLQRGITLTCDFLSDIL